MRLSPEDLDQQMRIAIERDDEREKTRGDPAGMVAVRSVNRQTGDVATTLKTKGEQRTCSFANGK
jgi:hypothetical protein